MKQLLNISLKNSFYVLLINLLTILFYCPAIVQAESLEQFAGAHTRVVWVQEQGNGADTYGFGENFKLMGYDSRDGKKERPLLKQTENFYKPIITPDGKKVVVSSRSRHEIYLVDFKKGKRKSLGKGVAVDVWQDPANGKVWVYALAGDGPENKYFTTHPLVRFPIKKPKKREQVWSKTHLSWSNFDMSRDGKFAGGLFPWPDAGILLFEQNTWKKYGKGCWTSLSPDNSAILWVFDGLHRNLNFVNPFTAKFWTTNINSAPGIGGFEVYHPRWSNHVRFMTMTGPYVEGEGGNKINGGGQKVEVYVGRFSPNLKSIEGWFQVTHNDRADFYPDVWIENGAQSNVSSGKPQPLPVVANGEDADWPGDLGKLVFLWQDLMAENKLGDSSLLGFSQFTVTPKTRAYFNRFLEMDFNQSGFVASIPGEKIAATIQKKNGIGIEFLYTPLVTGAHAEGPVFRLQTEKNTDFLSVFQQEKSLEVTLFKNNTEIGKIMVPDVLHPNRPEHLFIDLQDKQLKLYVNGRLIKDIVLNASPFTSMQNLSLLLGHPEENTFGLNGSISHVAMYATAFNASEITRKAHKVTGEIEARKEIKPIQLKGELIETSTIPAPDSLGAYRRALVVNRFRISDILQGNYSEKEILVAQWAVLDRTVLPETKDYKVGTRLELKVEKFDQHPELEGERLMMDMFDPDLELYYQVRF
ncbi:MAG TPA: hypothetical protein EYG88_03460 [Desulfocapsa sulfexigens]|nr:hypothetical protein [Desulfocapsa sulfexigens]